MIAPEPAADILDRALDDVLGTRERPRAVPSYVRSWQRESFASMLAAHEGMLSLLQVPHGHLHGNELWREIIRVQQLQSECASVVPELEKRHANAFRRWWYTMIETSSRLNRNQTAGPVLIGLAGRARIHWLMAFGKTAFKR